MVDQKNSETTKQSATGPSATSSPATSSPATSASTASSSAPGPATAKVPNSADQSQPTTPTDPTAQSSQSATSGRKVRSGYVISNMMQKTIVVEVISRVRHPLYHKIVRRTRRFHAHDELNSANVGDLVTIMETRPLSKTKRFRLLEIVEKAK
jgi:small subunit ribosomal protein S17